MYEEDMGRMHRMYEGDGQGMYDSWRNSEITKLQGKIARLNARWGESKNLKVNNNILKKIEIFRRKIEELGGNPY